MKAGNVRLVTVIIFLSQACCKPPEKISSRDDTGVGQADTFPANTPDGRLADFPGLQTWKVQGRRFGYRKPLLFTLQILDL